VQADRQATVFLLFSLCCFCLAGLGCSEKSSDRQSASDGSVTSQAEAKPVAPARIISQDEFLQLAGSNGGLLVLDVRTGGEFSSGHIAGAVNVPHDTLKRRIAEFLPRKGEDVVVYCESGGRTRMAISTLRRAGFESVLHLEGDMAAWRRSGQPLE